MVRISFATLGLVFVLCLRADAQRVALRIEYKDLFVEYHMDKTYKWQSKHSHEPPIEIYNCSLAWMAPDGFVLKQGRGVIPLSLPDADPKQFRLYPLPLIDDIRRPGFEFEGKGVDSHKSPVFYASIQLSRIERIEFVDDADLNDLGPEWFHGLGSLLITLKGQTSSARVHIRNRIWDSYELVPVVSGYTYDAAGNTAELDVRFPWIRRLTAIDDRAAPK
ncbi:MAG: hypothetical protein ABSF64_05050 [Bryobacteraceae bacterium]|jgi:hypothetical protein